MTPEESAKITARIGTTFTPMTEAKAVMWMEFLAPLQFDRSLDTCRSLRDSEDRMPSIAKFKEAYEALRHKYPTRALPRPTCGVCVDGWVSVRCNTVTHDCSCGPEFDRLGGICPNGSRTSARCPNGCVPMTLEERQEHDRQLMSTQRRREPVPVDDMVRERTRDFTESTPREEVF